MEKKVYKYTFVGTHSTGKSSGATYLAALLKQKFPGKSVKVIEENVRELSKLFDGKHNTPAFQKLVMSDHLTKELTACQIYDVVVCDRSSLDTLCYGFAYKIKLEPELFSLALNHMNTFDMVFFVRPDGKAYDDGFRDTNEELRMKVDEVFDGFLHLWGGKWIEIRSSQIFTFPYLEKLEIK